MCVREKQRDREIEKEKYVDYVNDDEEEDDEKYTEEKQKEKVEEGEADEEGGDGRKGKNYRVKEMQIKERRKKNRRVWKEEGRKKIRRKFRKVRKCSFLKTRVGMIMTFPYLCSQVCNSYYRDSEKCLWLLVAKMRDFKCLELLASKNKGLQKWEGTCIWIHSGRDMAGKLTIEGWLYGSWTY